MAPPANDLTRRLSRERERLVEAEAEIGSGRHRLEAQEHLLSKLEGSGQNTAVAARLSDIFKRLLVQWERRRQLIEQRISYLEHEDRRPRTGR